jgi:hypothetical protein
MLTVRHPGETVRLHWITTPLGPASNFVLSTVRLHASLSGPFDPASTIKASQGSPAVTAAVVVTTNRVGDSPVSFIVIPEDAPAGAYKLTTTVDQDGEQVAGGSVIQVSARK